jgi:hypothetical protein
LIVKETIIYRSATTHCRVAGLQAIPLVDVTAEDFLKTLFGSRF